MRIIKRVEPIPKTLRITCRACHSIVEYLESEVQTEYDPRPGESGRHAKCPVCGCENGEHHYGVKLWSKWHDILKAMLDERERLNAPWMAIDALRPKACRDELKTKYGL